MSNPQSGPEPHRHSPGGYSPDCIDLFYDEPANAIDQALPPALLEQARASREKLIRYKEIEAPPGPNADTHEEVEPSPSEEVAAPEAVNGVVRVPLDAVLRVRLHGLDRPIELIDENGKVIARVTPLASAECQ